MGDKSTGHLEKPKIYWEKHETLARGQLLVPINAIFPQVVWSLRPDKVDTTIASNAKGLGIRVKSELMKHVTDRTHYASAFST